MVGLVGQSISLGPPSNLEPDCPDTGSIFRNRESNRSSLVPDQTDRFSPVHAVPDLTSTLC